jgi:glycosyltransferase involved in cell wall biosynthesis
MNVCNAVQKAGLDACFKVIGDGPRLNWARSFAKKHALNNITFEGRVTRDEVASKMKAADVLIFTSLSEANTSTFFEALQSICIPVALDLDGFSRNITSEIGFKININQPYAKIVHEYVAVLRELSMNKDHVLRLRDNIKKNLSSYSWEELFNRHYKQIEKVRLR